MCNINVYIPHQAHKAHWYPMNTQNIALVDEPLIRVSNTSEEAFCPHVLSLVKKKKNPVKKVP